MSLSFWIQPRDWPPPGAGPAAPRRPLVLFIEDDPAILEMYRMQLAADGLEVVTALEGGAGLAAARKRRPDLILLDLRLPGIDGLEVLTALKGDPNLAEVYVVVLSNYGDPDMVRQGLRLGATLYLLKSQTVPGELSRKIRELLGRGSEQAD